MKLYVEQHLTREEIRTIVLFFTYIFTMLSAFGGFSAYKKYKDSAGTLFDMLMFPDKNDPGDAPSAVKGALLLGQAAGGIVFLFLYLTGK